MGGNSLTVANCVWRLFSELTASSSAGLFQQEQLVVFVPI
jgi:hypothetical protein